MGRTEPSVGRPPAGFRRDARAKRAKATINKVIPAILAAHPRARKGIDASELIVDPPPPSRSTPLSQSSRQKSNKKGRADDGGNGVDEKGKGKRVAGENKNGPRIAIHVADTLEAAYALLLVPASASASSSPEQRQDLSNKEARVGILNMASPLSPGGGFLNGAASQEEFLCGHTTLLPALRDEFYRLPEVGAVFTSDVLVFRGSGGSSHSSSRQKGKQNKKTARNDDDAEAGEVVRDEGGEDAEAPLLVKGDRWFVDVVSAAMLRMPEIEVDEDSGWASYANTADRELAVRKMRAVMRVFAAKSVRKVVLGAWGCGAYSNPVREVARAWRKVLLGAGSSQKKGKSGKKEKAVDSWENIEDIVFAIKDEGMARAFATAFGEDLLERLDAGGEDSSEDEEEDVEDTNVRELRDKIREMELRIEQARTPQLKAGLNSVLAGLRSQLPSDSDNEQRSSQRSTTESSEEESDADEARNGHDSEGQNSIR
ncbi:hypothetical protein F4821DRAFT_102555 [Hypoxylon rubiginosum]|uniref:Uncharacterized protein n=1 Tax=Hypoxylon rubiginosum TaxID=110542 RepID=A0ACC0D5N9_9PEZI|nr:hypothetical protein F4821DRAFT_102555 [Hypoxylon rubiginosum]